MKDQEGLLLSAAALLIAADWPVGLASEKRAVKERVGWLDLLFSESFQAVRRPQTTILSTKSVLYSFHCVHNPSRNSFSVLVDFLRGEGRSYPEERDEQRVLPSPPMERALFSVCSVAKSQDAASRLAPQLAERCSAAAPPL